MACGKDRLIRQRVVVIVEGDSRDVRRGPSHEGAVPVLAENISVHLLLIDGIEFGKAGSQTNGVENGARA